MEHMEYYKQKNVEKMDEIEDGEKGELLCGIASIVEILPVSECQRMLDYLSELYLS
ncbi:MAG: hypothetical protein HFH62_11285 [Lachnospiraceae bacterium]|nr:hypothetical protein [Lachnospiraceae bacterium]